MNRNRLQGAKQNPIPSTLAQQHQPLQLDSARSQSTALSAERGGGGQGKAQAERTTAMLTVNFLINFLSFMNLKLNFYEKIH